MKTFSCLKYSAVLLPALALGVPMAHAVDPGNQGTQQRTTASDRAQTAQTTHGSYMNAPPSQGFHSDDLVGSDVMNRRNNETVGQVSDLVLNKDGQVVAVIISVGGLLGIGDRDVAIGWDQIERRVDGDDITLSVDLPDGSLDDAPEYDNDRSARHTGMSGMDRDRQRTAPGAEQRSEQGVAQRAGQTTEQRTAQGTAQRDQRDQRDQRARTASSGDYLEAIPANGFHSDNLIGQTVKSRQDDKSLGDVSNLVLDTDGQVVAVIISVGGLMGIGARDVAIAWDQIDRQMDDDEVTLWVNLSEQSLKDAPKYSTDRSASRRNR